jgi:sterol 3beta-glucosyltransferase
MVNRDTERIGRVVLETLARTRRRGIILSGWGGWKSGRASAEVLYLDSVPHDWLFPRCAVIVHHGGAGTTAAGLRYGKPNIVVPFAGDQPFWGKRIAALGAGPQPIPVKKLTVESLAAAMTQSITDMPMRQRAAELGKKILAEDGVETAVKLIEETARIFRR